MGQNRQPDFLIFLGIRPGKLLLTIAWPLSPAGSPQATPDFNTTTTLASAPSSRGLSGGITRRSSHELLLDHSPSSSSSSSSLTQDPPLPAINVTVAPTRVRHHLVNVLFLARRVCLHKADGILSDKHLRQPGRLVPCLGLFACVAHAEQPIPHSVEGLRQVPPPRSHPSRAGWPARFGAVLRSWSDRRHGALDSLCAVAALFRGGGCLRPTFPL